MAAELAESYELDPFAALLLVSRGVTADNADEFLYPQCDIDPFCFLIWKRRQTE